jgi:uncharacterized OsmC-like protein
MKDEARWRDIYERKVRLLRAKPSFARSAGTATARMGEGFACAVSSGPFTLSLDLGEADGGRGAAPGPGQVMRSAVAACLAMGYRQWAVRLGVPMDDVEVEMTCELDARGQLGMDEAGVPARWQRVVWTVRVVSSADEPEVLRVLDHADRTSPMLDNLDKAIEKQRKVEITRRTP